MRPLWRKDTEHSNNLQFHQLRIHARFYGNGSEYDLNLRNGKTGVRKVEMDMFTFVNVLEQILKEMGCICDLKIKVTFKLA